MARFDAARVQQRTDVPLEVDLAQLRRASLKGEAAERNGHGNPDGLNYAHSMIPDEVMGVNVSNSTTVTSSGKYSMRAPLHLEILP